MQSASQCIRLVSSTRVLRLLLLLPLLPSSHASTPDTIVTIPGEQQQQQQQWFAKRAMFGRDDDDAAAVTGLLVHSPEFDELLCQYYDETEDRNFTVTPVTPPSGETWIMMVPRGGCTFERKAYAAKMWFGVSAVLIYDNLSARYQWSTITNRMKRWPEDETDYECQKGFGIVSNLPSLDSAPYSRQLMDPILDMTSPSTGCTLQSTGDPCESQLCLVTGPAKEGSSDYPVCCAWDLPVTMIGDGEASPGNTDDVVAVFLTIRQGEAIVQYVGQTISLQPRPYTAFNASQIFLWLMGISIAFIATYLSASDLRIFRIKLEKYEATKEKKEAAELENPPNPTTSIDSDDIADLVLDIDDLYSDEDDVPLATEGEEEESRERLTLDAPEPVKPKRGAAQRSKTSKEQKVWSLHSLPKKGKENDRGEVFTLFSLPPPERKPKEKKQRQRPGYKAEVTMVTDVLPSDGEGRPVPTAWATPIGGFEMTHWHVFGFVLFSSFMLFMLFFFRFYPVVFVLYGFGCAGAVSHVIFGPIIVRAIPFLGDGVVNELNKKVVCGLNGFDITSQILGYVWAIVWIWYGLSHYRPSTNAFFWITMNIFGASFCIVALSMMKLGSIKVATLLLLMVFVYDIFFVFITPLFLGGESIMITVAKGGAGDSTADDFCYKYPDDKDCTGIDFLPMLLIVPRLNDYRDGSSLLGLGDIVLPGFLIAFCARLDEAKRIVGKHTDEEMEYTERWYQGYFFWLMVAYAVGLAMAFAAFGISGTGQPALLYLVPCCLGMICLIGRNELKDLWTGSRAVQLALESQNQFERAWGKEKMRRDVAKAKRLRQEAAAHHPFRSIETLSGRGEQGGRGRGGPGRGRGGPGRGRGVRDGERDNGRSSITSTPDASQKSPSNANGLVHPVSPRSPGRYAATIDGSPRKGATSKSRGRMVKPDLLGDETRYPQGPMDRKNPRGPIDMEDARGSLDRKDSRFPMDIDVCFGDPKNLGVRHVRTVIKREIKADTELEFGPSVLASIKKRLAGRGFFVSDGAGGWRRATTSETASEISKLFNAEKAGQREKPAKTIDTR